VSWERSTRVHRGVRRRRPAPAGRTPRILLQDTRRRAGQLPGVLGAAVVGDRRRRQAQRLRRCRAHVLGTCAASALCLILCDCGLLQYGCPVTFFMHGCCCCRSMSCACRRDLGEEEEAAEGQCLRSGNSWTRATPSR
jgi:hypothetical protein